MAKKQKKKDYREVTFIDTKDRIYLAVKGAQGYYFAYYDPESDEIKLTEEVTVDGMKYRPIPQKLNEDESENPIEYPTVDVVNAEVVDTESLSKEIKAHLRKYIDLGDDDMDLLTFYILFTWFYPKNSTVAYLRFIGDTGKGKSRMLTVTGDLCFYPLFAAGNATRSAIMRLENKYHGTLVLDEADFRGDKENEMIKFLNAGFERRKKALISDQNNADVVHAYDPFSPKILAMRETFGDSATERRLISISPYMTRRKDIPPILPPSYHKEVKALRDKIAAWAMRNWSKVEGEQIELSMQLPVEPQLKQLAASLSTILPLFDDRVNNRFVWWIIDRQRKMAEQRDNTAEAAIVGAIVDIVRGITTGIDLPEKFHKYVDFSPSADPTGNGKIMLITAEMLGHLTGLYRGKVGKVLKELHFYHRVVTCKIGDEKTRVSRIFIEDTARWVDLWRDYRSYEPIIEVPDILKDPEREYDSVLEHLYPPTDLEIELLSQELAGDEPVRCRVREKFTIYSRKMAKDVLLEEGITFRCSKELAVSLMDAGKVVILEEGTDE